MSLGNENVKITSLQQYVLLHRPEQPSIPYLTLALSFSMRLNFILKYTNSARIWGLHLRWLLCLRDSLLLAFIHVIGRDER